MVLYITNYHYECIKIVNTSKLIIYKNLQDVENKDVFYKEIIGMFFKCQLSNVFVKLQWKIQQPPSKCVCPL